MKLVLCAVSAIALVACRPGTLGARAEPPLPPIPSVRLIPSTAIEWHVSQVRREDINNLHVHLIVQPRRDLDYGVMTCDMHNAADTVIATEIHNFLWRKSGANYEDDIWFYEFPAGGTSIVCTLREAH